MKRRHFFAGTAALASMLGLSRTKASAQAATPQIAQSLPASGAALNRTVLPPPTPPFRGKIGQTYKDSTPDWTPALPLEAPAGAPNILMIVLDDVGFGHLGCYGGPIDTPNIDKIAASGLRYTNFHTTALCSPTRAALLTGRNHHAVAMASITEGATGYPGNFGSIPKSAALISEVLKQNGYNTFAQGKWHLTPYTATTAAGPFDRWPTGQGFEKYYGFIGGETDQWAPLLAQDTHFVPIPQRQGYHLTEDLIDRAIADIRDQQQIGTGRPFFCYLALGACHAPLHAPKAYIDKYQGRFDQGWDQVRQETYERQKQMGVIPPDTQLPPANAGVPAWSELTADQKKVYARLQEVFAGFLDHADQQIGRLMTALDNLGIRENTFVLIVSDNGASQEGLQHGTANTDRYRNFFPDTVEEMLPLLDKLGSAETDPHYPKAWAMAGNTPLKRWKQDTHAGGNTDPLIIAWPARIQQVGQIRSQYHHVVDVVPTLLEITQLPAPTSVNGVEQMPLHGVSMAYSFDSATVPTQKKSQYYEMFGSRAIWAEGWTAVVWHEVDKPYAEEAWELYHTAVDFSQTNNLAQQEPERLRSLQALWDAEAQQYNVYPMDDRRYDRVADPTRPQAAPTLPVYTYYPGTSIVPPLAAPQMLGKDHTVTAYATIPASGAEGILACYGTEFGGWTLFIQNGKLHYVHNYLKIKDYAVSSSTPISPGPHTFSYRFKITATSTKPDYFDGDITLLIDDNVVAELKGVRSAAQYSVLTGYGLQIGQNMGTPVSHAYTTPFPFRGDIEKVTIVLGSPPN